MFFEGREDLSCSDLRGANQLQIGANHRSEKHWMRMPANHAICSFFVVSLGLDFRAFHFQLNLLQRLVHSKLFQVDLEMIYVQIMCFRIFWGFGLDLRARLELGKLSVERLPPDPFSAMKFVMAWLLACWLGRLADFLMACFWLVCWLAGLLFWLVAFWFAGFLLCLLAGIFLAC